MPKKVSRRAPSGETSTTVAAPKRKRRAAKPKTGTTPSDGDGLDKSFQSDFRKSVKEMKGVWDDAKEKKVSSIFEPADIPDGTYVAQVTSCGVQRFGPDGDFFLETMYVILRGPHEGVVLRSQETISDDPAFGEFLRIDLVLDHLRQLNVNVDKSNPTQIPAMAKQVADEAPTVRIRVRNTFKEVGGVDKHYQNVNVNKVLSEDDLAD